MRMKIDIAILVILIACVLPVLNAITLLQNLPADADINYEKLMNGNIIQLLFSQSYWSAFPSFPVSRPKIMFKISPVIISFLMTLGAWYYICRRKKEPIVIVAFFTIPMSLVPCVLGGFFLMAAETSLRTSGSVLAFMLLGMFYSLCMGLLISGIDLFFQIHPRHRRKLIMKRKLHRHFAPKVPHEINFSGGFELH